jgi:hypothetical protein
MAATQHVDGSDYKGRHRVPDLEADRNEILGFRDRHFNWYSVYRNRHLERMSRSMHYYIGNQWIELDREVLLETARGHTFRDTRSRGEIELPRPVTNFCGPAVDSELATLNKRRLKPKVIASKRHPRAEAAARVSQEVLDDRLKRLDWPTHRDRFIWNTITTGTGFLKSYWDTPHDKMTRIGNPDAVVCPHCSNVLSSPIVPVSLRSRFPSIPSSTQEHAPEDEAGEPELELSECPFCTGGNKLQPFEVSPEMATSMQDAAGRPMGYDVPKGNTAIEAPSPFYMFPENSGVGVTPDNCRFYGQASIRSLDWIAERYPDRMDDVSAEDPELLMEQHPILGEHHLLGWYNSTLDSSIYEDHAHIYEIHAERSHRFPEGRSIVIAGESTILDDGPLYRTYQGPDGEDISVPSVQYAAARFKVRAGEFWGHSLIDDIISPQNRINAIDAQVIDARDRMGSPNLLATEGMEMTGPEWVEEYGGGKIMTYIPDPMAPGERPEVFGSILMPTGVYQEREACREDIRSLAGPQPIQQGEAPKNVSTTSGLQLLGEQAELISEPKLRGIETALEAIWEHQLKLIWTLRTDPDEYEVDTDTDGYEVKQFTREDIEGQTRVKIEKQAFIEKSIYDREAAREAQADGLYNTETPRARKRLLEIRGLPTDINEDESLQIDAAKRMWVEFTDDGRVPVIDESLDDPNICWQVLGTYLKSNEGIRLSTAASWPQVLKSIGGWQMELMEAEQADMLARQYYGPELAADPPAAEEKYAADMLDYEAALEDFTRQQAQLQAQQQQILGVQAEIAALPPEQQQGELAALQAGIPPQAPLVPPVPPPAPLFLPMNKEDRVYIIWKRMLERLPVVPPEQALEDLKAYLEASDEFLRFRAVVEAYKLLADAQMQAQMAPEMVGTGTPPAPPNPANPVNVPNPGTSEALSNAGAV